MKKTVLCGLIPVILLAGTTAIAHERHEGHEGHSFGGWYAGASIGESSTTGKADIARTATLTGPGTVFNASSSIKGQLKKTSFTGALFAGYGYTCWSPFYLGAEIFVKAAEGKTKYFQSDAISATGGLSVSNTTGLISKVRSGEYGVDLRPGFLVMHNTLLYGRVGVGFNRLSLKVINSFTTAGNNFSFVQNRNKNVGALRLGAGIEHHFCGKWSARVDYIYTNYGKKSVSNLLSASAAGHGASVSSSASSRLANHSVMLGVSRYW